MDLFQPGHCEVHRLYLGHCGDLRQCQDKTLGQFPGGGQRGDEQVKGLQATCPGGGLEAFEADADERRGGTRGNGFADSLGRRYGRDVFRFVTAVAVAVLEVEAQVLDRFAAQLGSHTGGDGGSQFRLLAQKRAEPFETAVGLRRRDRLGAPFCGERRRETVRRDVHGVHGLAGAVVARVVAFQQLVGRGQLGVYRGEIGRREGGCGHSYTSS